MMPRHQSSFLKASVMTKPWSVLERGLVLTRRVPMILQERSGPGSTGATPILLETF